MAALIAVEAGKAMMQVATTEETLQNLGLDRPMDEAGGIEFRAVSAHTLKEGTCPWVTWTVGTARRLLRVRAHDRLPVGIDLVRCTSARSAQMEGVKVKNCGRG